MIEFIGLKSKCYAVSYIADDGSVKDLKRSKGVNKCATKRFTVADYRQVLQESLTIRASMKRIRSLKHQVFTQQLTKIVLDAYDDKRWIMDDGVETIPYGHWAIRFVWCVSWCVDVIVRCTD
jgi:hypothetical protein